MANARLYPFWGSLTEALRTGEPQNEAKRGGDLFDELYADPERLKGFVKAMTGSARGRRRPWPPSSRGGTTGPSSTSACAEGGLPVQLASAHPHLTGGGFDLPDVRSALRGVRRRARPGRPARASTPATSSPIRCPGRRAGDGPHPPRLGSGAEAPADRQGVRALPPGGALIVYDSLIDDERRENAFGLLMSLNMLIETRGGFDYTGADCTAGCGRRASARRARSTWSGPSRWWSG